MSNLPVKSTSRNIQRRHVRRLQTRSGVKDVLVNPKVNKNGVQSSQVVRPVFESKRRVLPVVQSSGQLSVSSRIVLSPKRRVIMGPDDLWDRLSSDPRFTDFIGELNNNQDIAKEELWDFFNDVPSDRDDDDSKLDALHDEFLAGEWHFRHGGSDMLRVTKWGDWDKVPDVDIPASEGTWSITSDPFDGAIFKKNNGVVTEYDARVFVGEEMDGAGGFAEELINEPEKDNLRMMRDHYFLKYLVDKDVPFLHMMQGQAYRGPGPDFILVPREFARDLKRAKAVADVKASALEKILDKEERMKKKK